MSDLTGKAREKSSMDINDITDENITDDEDRLEGETEKGASENQIHEDSEQGMEKTACENGIIKEPKEGMEFSSLQEVHDYYTNYARQTGFGVTKRTQKKGDDGELRYFAFVCSREGKRRSTSKKNFKPSLSIKAECQARIRSTLQKNGKFKLTTVVLEHNHALSPRKARFFRSNKKLDNHVKRKLELNDQAGIGVSKNFHSFVVEAGGYGNLTFGEKDCRNHIEKARRLRLGVGDGEAIRNYFIKMQGNNSNFFYMMDLDDKSRLRNVFWADARSRAAYEDFGDVITFDTTYLTNKYELPFAPFVGVNHHGQSILLGCGLLSHENTESFVWLFESWLSCMSGRAPKAIITDQCKAMQNAVEKVFPEARHRWCLWHILKKVPEKLSRFSLYENIKTTLHNVVYDSLTIEEFEDGWVEMINKYDLSENEWLGDLYKARDRWVPSFLKDTFWAGMSTTQRSESMNAFFDDYVNSKTTLKQFVEQYDNALKSKVEKEKQEDFRSLNSMYECLTDYDFEKQVQSVFTNAKFKEFQEELKRLMYCHPTLNEEKDSYEVTEDVKCGENKWKHKKYTVHFSEDTYEVNCMCRLFEFRGILCRHSLSVFTLRKVKEIPERYILSRWRKDLKHAHTFVKTSYNELDLSPDTQRYTKMSNSFHEVATLAKTSEEKCEIVMGFINEMKTKLLADEGICGSSLVEFAHSPKCTNDGIEMTNRSGKVLSPSVVKRRGRPLVNRKVSKVEEVIKKLKNVNKKKEVKENTKNKRNWKKNFQQEKILGKAKIDGVVLTSNTPSIMNETGTQESSKLTISNEYLGGNHGMEYQPQQLHGNDKLGGVPHPSNTPLMVNEIGTQESSNLSISNQLLGGAYYGMGYLNLLSSLQANQNLLWNGGMLSAQGNIQRTTSIDTTELDVKVARLVQLGFGREVVIEALQFSNGDERKAIEFLHNDKLLN